MFDLHSAIADLPGSTRARQLLVENSLKYLAALSAESGNQPDLQRELASAYEKVADIQAGYRSANVGDPQGAIASYQQALAIRTALLKANPADDDMRRELLRNEGKLGDVSLDIDPAQAIEHARRAATIAEEIARAHRTEIGDQRNLANANLSLGWYLANSGAATRGLVIMGRAAAIFEGLVDVEPKNVITRRNLAIAYERQGEILLKTTTRYDEALRVHEKSLALIQALEREDPVNANLRRMEGFALLGMGKALSKQGKAGAALAKQLQAADILRRLFNADPNNDAARFPTALAVSEAAGSLAAMRDLKAAERRYLEAVNTLAESPSANERGLNRTRGLLASSYLGLAHAIASQTAAEPGRSDRRFRCEQARNWQKMAVPILALADQDPSWRAEVMPRSEQAAAALAACGAPTS
jgi:tetratricopeptide (TPR) repeat protein